MTVDLSAFYIDISKDRLYTFAEASPERRSTQTAIYLITEGLTRLLAPLLPVTTDELWHHLPGDRDESVHLADFPTGTDQLIDRELIQRWTRLRNIRDAVNIDLEHLRKQKTVGTSLEARVMLRAWGTTATLLETYRTELPTLLITSQVDLSTEAEMPSESRTSDKEATTWQEPDGVLEINVARVAGIKCPRCWRYVDSVSTDPALEGLCERCVSALSESISAN